jgi:hypothetical protein
MSRQFRRINSLPEPMIRAAIGCSLDEMKVLRIGHRIFAHGKFREHDLSQIVAHSKIPGRDENTIRSLVFFHL